MNIIKKFLLFIKNIFIKQNNIKKLMAPNNIAETPAVTAEVNTLLNKKSNFVNSLKVNTIEKSTNKKITTLTCIGDGLGIRKKLSY